MRADPTDRVLARIDGMREEMVAALAEAVAIRSVNPAYPDQDYDDLVGGETEVSRLLARLYRQAGAETELFGEVPGRDNVVGVVRGRGGGRSLILNGHVDVVPADDAARWSHDPFTAFVDETHVWGRGTADMKGGLVAQAFAALALAGTGTRLRGDLVLQGVVGEENLEHRLGTSAVLIRGFTADGAIIGEPTGVDRPLAVMPATPGVLIVHITVTGRSAHASMRSRMRSLAAAGEPAGEHAAEAVAASVIDDSAAPVAASAIDAALRIHDALRRLEAEWFDSRTDPLFEKGQFTIGLNVVDGAAHGSRSVAFIPDRTTLEYAVFYPPATGVSEIRSEIARTVREIVRQDPWLRANPPRIDWPMHYPGGRTDRDHPLCRTVRAARERAALGTPFAGPGDVLPFPSATDLTWFTAAGIPAVGLGPGAQAMAHAVDERCAIDELVGAAKAYALAAVAWCGVA
ncbi:M20 family metallopeptidase [Kitasatospora sp. NPDC056184]|uniref:M20 family metallopeptidase n=1 Tax=Kitasatospora sp. NPDC056184 TaxID=3345738 RepID=UPI0035DB73E5